MDQPNGPPRHGMRATTFALGLWRDLSLPSARLQHFCHHPAANLTTVQEQSRSLTGQNSPLCGWSLALGFQAATVPRPRSGQGHKNKGLILPYGQVRVILCAVL
jgi:hypothetical protein